MESKQYFSSGEEAIKKVKERKNSWINLSNLFHIRNHSFSTFSYHSSCLNY